ncbi:hemerythrin domain-containing protein [Dactylosporangium sp. NPDC051541]|uniref:hemerythrin domain-containing protein n=1 Tax=Dactylosporangium sp. NPDC051541 TaxID=3363977 RepID=UPI0037B7C0B5
MEARDLQDLTLSEFSPPRLAALGNQLIEIHQHLRSLLADSADLPDFSRSLRAHCLAFCGALDRHHTGEERGAFRALAASHPSLRPVLDELRRDHEQLAALLRRVEANPTKAELAGLAAVMESHFTFEEKRLAAVLNELP